MVPSAYFAMGLPFLILNMVCVLMFKGLGIADSPAAGIFLATSIFASSRPSIRPSASPCSCPAAKPSALPSSLAAARSPLLSMSPYLCSLFCVFSARGSRNTLNILWLEVSGKLTSSWWQVCYIHLRWVSNRKGSYGHRDYIRQKWQCNPGLSLQFLPWN